MKYVLLFLSLSCFGGLEMRCDSVTVTNLKYSYMYRCENSEVICYRSKSDYQGGVSCKFKEPTPKALSKHYEDEVNKKLVPTMIKEGNKWKLKLRN